MDTRNPSQATLPAFSPLATMRKIRRTNLPSPRKAPLLQLELPKRRQFQGQLATSCMDREMRLNG